jgi:hypothetical protein
MNMLDSTKEIPRDLSRRSAESEWLDDADATPEDLALVLRDRIAVSRYANMNRLAAFNATADAGGLVEGGIRQLMTQVCIGAASVTFHRARPSPNSADSKAASTCSILRKSSGVAGGARSCPIVRQINRWLN